MESELGRIVWVIGSCGGYAAICRWLSRRRGWAWGVEMNADMDAAAWRCALDCGLHPVLCLHANAGTRERQWRHWERPAPDPAAVVPAVSSACGSVVPVWQAVLEDDSAGVGFPQVLFRDRPRSHRDALACWERYLTSTLPPARGVAGDLPLWAVVGYVTSVHAAAAQRPDCLMIERANDDVGDLQTAIAFLRGASRQYDLPLWGIDLSLWWGPVYGCVHDMPGSFHWRHLWVSHMSGAGAYRIEGGDLMVPPDDGSTVLGETFERFGCLASDMVRGSADVPVAVMVPRDSGWLSPPYWRGTQDAWHHAHVGLRPGDVSLSGFFAMAFPGSRSAMDPFPFGAYEHDDPPASPFALSCVAPEFSQAPEDVFTADPYLPFGRFRSRDEARAAFAVAGADPAPYRPMADSRWGDVLDVFTEDCRLEILEAYPVLVLLGALALDTELSLRLRAYVEQGGHLVAAVGVVRPEHRALTGLDLGRELRAGRAWRVSGSGDVVHEAYRFVPCRVLDSSRTNTWVQAPSGAPLVTQHRLGSGSVTTCLVPWFAGEGVDLCGPARWVFNEVVGAVQPLQVDGLPVEWVSCHGATHRSVLVVNHGSDPWTGRLRVRDVSEDLSCCRERVSGRSMEFRRDTSGAVDVDVSVPAGDVAVLQWSRPSTSPATGAPA